MTAMKFAHHPAPSRILWGRRASNALEALDPADKDRIASTLFTTIDAPVHKRQSISIIQPVRDGRGLQILRASEHIGVLFRRLEDGDIEIVDVVTRDHARTFSAFY
jgi:hypothetical protein